MVAVVGGTCEVHGVGTQTYDNENADVDVDSSRMNRVSLVHLTGEPKILEASTCACALQFCANCNFVPPVAWVAELAACFLDSAVNSLITQQHSLRRVQKCAGSALRSIGTLLLSS